MATARRWLALTLATVSLVGVSPAPAGLQVPPAPTAQPESDALAKRLDDLILRKGLGQFWGAVVVAKDGVPVLAKGYGLANESLAPIGPDTLFDIASCSKQFTAAAVLKLEMEGKLSTDDPVAKFFPDLAEQLGDRGRDIHLIHLLTHTSGMADERAIQQLDFPDRDRAVMLAITSAPSAKPGEKWDYCNAGYIVLAAVIERVSGGTYENYLREHIFGPAGLRSTGFLDGVGLDASKATVREVGDPASGMAPQRWTLISGKSGGEPWAWGLRGAGGIVTTLEDLVRWDRALAGETVLNAAAKEKLFRPVLSGYACGWQVEGTGAGTRKIHHSGGTRGYRAELARYPEEGVFIAVLTNTTWNPTEIENLLAQEVFPEEKESLSASLLVGGLELGEWGQYQDAGPWRWNVAAGPQGTVTASLQRGQDHAVARMVLSRGTARKLAARVESSGPGEPIGGTKVSVSTKPYENPGNGEIALPAGITLEVMPAYHGMGENGVQIIDQRPTLVIMDAPNSFWPLIVTMDADTAAAFVKDLRAATSR